MLAHLFLAVAVFLASSAPQVRVTRLNGDVVVGALHRVTSESISIDGDESAGDDLAIDALLDLQVMPSVTRAPAATASVEFVDGSILPISDFQLQAGEAHLALDRAVFGSRSSASGPVSELRVAASDLQAVHLLPPSREISAQWREIRAQTLPSDVLIVRKSGGLTVDYLEGIIGDVTQERVIFDMQGDPLRIKRSKVDGFIFYRRPRDDAQPLLGRIHGASGLVVQAAELEFVGGDLNIVTTGGLALTWPFHDIERIDFSTGKLLYLSDASATISWQPKLALPVDTAAVAAFNHPQVDRSFTGTSLSLLWPSDHGGKEVAYEKGLAIRSRSILEYDLPSGYREFAAYAGIDPRTQRLGRVQLRLFLDDENVFDAMIAGGQTPRTIKFPIQGARHLRIEVDYGDQFDWGDSLHLADAKLTK